MALKKNTKSNQSDLDAQKKIDFIFYGLLNDIENKVSRGDSVNEEMDSLYTLLKIIQVSNQIT